MEHNINVMDVARTRLDHMVGRAREQRNEALGQAVRNLKDAIMRLEAHAEYDGTTSLDYGHIFGLLQNTMSSVTHASMMEGRVHAIQETTSAFEFALEKADVVA